MVRTIAHYSGKLNLDRVMTASSAPDSPSDHSLPGRLRGINQNSTYQKIPQCNEGNTRNHTD